MTWEVVQGDALTTAWAGTELRQGGQRLKSFNRGETVLSQEALRPVRLRQAAIGVWQAIAKGLRRGGLASLTRQRG